jgi:hypothetical protein
VLQALESPGRQQARIDHRRHAERVAARWGHARGGGARAEANAPRHTQRLRDVAGDGGHIVC